MSFQMDRMEKPLGPLALQLQQIAASRGEHFIFVPNRANK